MKIIVKKVRPEQRRKGLHKWGRRGRTVSVVGAAALALLAMRGAMNAPVSVTVSADANLFVSESDGALALPAISEVAADIQPEPRSGGSDSLTVDDELDDLLLDGEEIDSGISVSYNGKLDVPSNVRLDRLDFGSDFVKPLRKARVTSRFDYRVNPVTGRYVFHTGMDLGAASGSSRPVCLILPPRAKTLVPFAFSVPIAANHSAPLRMMRGMLA